MDTNKKSKISERLSKLIQKYSVDELLEYKFLKNHVLKFKHKDVDIYPEKLEVAIQMYESTTDFKLLNKANTLEEYEKVYTLLEKKCLDVLRPESPKGSLDVLRPESPKGSLDVLLQFTYFLQKFSEKSIRNQVFKSEKRFTIFPIHTMFIDNYKKKIKIAGHHASLCILDKESQTEDARSFAYKAYIIDSDNITNKNKHVVYSEQKYENYLCEKIKYSILSIIPELKILEKNKFSVEFLDVKTPQSITKDDYCIFWSFALTEELLRSLGSRELHSLKYSGSPEFNPSDILENFMKKYKSKKQLEKYIFDYILTHF